MLKKMEKIGGANPTKNAVLIILGLVVISFAAIVFTHYFYNRPWNRAFLMDPIDKFDTGEKIVALTFDDGPSKQRTPKLLDLLNQHEVKVTFFVLGVNVEKNPEIAERIIDEGHLIANHSYSHPRMIFKSPVFIKKEIERTDKQLSDLGAGNLDYFRPPYCDKMIILPLVLKALDKKLVTCSFDPLAQYERDFNGDKVSSQVLNGIEPGCIVVLHDGRKDNVKEFVGAVEKIIVESRKQGYSFVTIEEGENVKE